MAKYIKELSFDDNKKLKEAIQKGYLDNYSLEWRHTFVGVFLLRYPLKSRIIDLFKELLGREPEWKDLTDSLLRDFTYYIDGKYAQNTKRTLYGRLKAVINEYKHEMNIPTTQYTKILRATKESVISTYLTRDEIETLNIYTPESIQERYVHKIFMIECLTGARTSDAKRLTLDNCNIETNRLTYIAQKTKQRVTIPIDDWLKPYLEDTTYVELNRKSTNYHLQKICRKCNILTPTTIFKGGKEIKAEKCDLITTHAGRRSFATNLYLHGIDPFTISQLMGHTSVERTITNYIVDYRPMDDNLLSFFQHK